MRTLGTTKSDSDDNHWEKLYKVLRVSDGIPVECIVIIENFNGVHFGSSNVTTNSMQLVLRR